jgi:ATP-dependent DNA helicase RecQ
LVVIQREEPKPKRKRKAEASILLPLTDKPTAVPQKAINYDELFELLRNLRKEIAAEEMVPPYIIFSDKTLQQLTLLHPTTIEAFGNVNGVGDYKKRKYGERFTQLIRRVLEQ